MLILLETGYCWKQLFLESIIGWTALMIELTKRSKDGFNGQTRTPPEKLEVRDSELNLQSDEQHITLDDRALLRQNPLNFEECCSKWKIHHIFFGQWTMPQLSLFGY